MNQYNARYYEDDREYTTTDVDSEEGEDMDEGEGEDMGEGEVKALCDEETRFAPSSSFAHRWSIEEISDLIRTDPKVASIDQRVLGAEVAKVATALHLATETAWKHSPTRNYKGELPPLSPYKFQLRIAAMLMITENLRAGGSLGGKGSMLCMDMGLGKTIVCILIIVARYLTEKKEGKREFTKTLIVSPNTVMQVWHSMFKEWFPALANFIGRSSNESTVVTVASINLFNKSDRPGIANRVFGRVIIDEAHAIKNDATNTYRCLDSIETGVRMLVTATPLQNTVKELKNLIKFIGGPPIEIVDKTKEGVRKEGVRKKSRVGEQAPLVLEEGIAVSQLESALLMFKAIRSDVWVEEPHLEMLPPSCNILMCNLSRCAVDMYNVLQSASTNKKVVNDFEFAALYRIVSIDAMGFLNHVADTADRMAKLKKYTDRMPQQATVYAEGYATSRKCFPELIGEDDEVYMGHKTAELFKDILAHQDEKAIVFCHYMKEVEVVVKAFSELNTALANKGKPTIPIAMLHGDMGQQEQEDNTKNFTEGPARVLISNVNTGGQGLNLQVASRVYKMSPDYNPAKEEQAFGRAYRIGQTKPVTLITMVANTEVEMSIYKMQSDKSVLMKTYTGSDVNRSKPEDRVTEIIVAAAVGVEPMEEASLADTLADLKKTLGVLDDEMTRMKAIRHSVNKTKMRTHGTKIVKTRQQITKVVRSIDEMFEGGVAV